jgi:type VI secretion system protein ImpI
VELLLKVKSKADASVQNVRHSVDGPVVLGRGPESAVPLEAPGISREHLEVQVEDSSLFLTDMSSNGTWINGARMPQRRKCKLRDGDFVELPGYEIQFQLIGTATPAIAAPRPAAGSSKPQAPSSPSGRRRSSRPSFGLLEVFLLMVAFASVALFAFYLAS